MSSSIVTPTYAPKVLVTHFASNNADEPPYNAVHVPDSLWKSFQQLIQRGAQTWADAPPAMKELADLVTNGQVLQNYWDQNKDIQKKSD